MLFNEYVYQCPGCLERFKDEKEVYRHFEVLNNNFNGRIDVAQGVKAVKEFSRMKDDRR